MTSSYKYQQLHKLFLNGMPGSLVNKHIPSLLLNFKVFI